MNVDAMLFNEMYRRGTPDRVYIVLDVSPDKINYDLLNMIHDCIVQTQLKTTIFYNGEAYTLLDMLVIMKNKEGVEGSSNVSDNLTYIHENFIKNSDVPIDNYLNIIVITDFIDIDKATLLANVNHLVNDYTIRGDEEGYAKHINFTTILYDVEINEEQVSSYIDVFNDHDLFKIEAGESTDKKIAKLESAVSKVYADIFDFKKMKTTGDLEISFMNDSDIIIKCNVHELGSHHLLANQVGYKTKLFEEGHPEKGEVYNNRFNLNPRNSQRIKDDEVDSCYPLATDFAYISSKKADKIYQNQVLIGDGNIVEENKPFLSVLGFIPMEKYNSVATLINVYKALELKPTQDEESQQMLYDLKNEMINSKTAMLCLGRTIGSKEIRNCAVVARRLSVLDPEDNIRLFIVDIPFKDEIRLFPKCAANEDYKTSLIEEDYYNEFKKVFENMFVSDRNTKISPESLDIILKNYNYKDVNTKNYEQIMKKKVLPHSDDVTGHVDELDQTYTLVENRNDYLHTGYGTELGIMHGINNAYYKQYQHLQASKKRVAKPRVTSVAKKTKKAV